MKSGGGEWEETEVHGCTHLPVSNIRTLILLAVGSDQHEDKG